MMVSVTVCGKQKWLNWQNVKGIEACEYSGRTVIFFTDQSPYLLVDQFPYQVLAQCVQPCREFLGAA